MFCGAAHLGSPESQRKWWPGSMAVVLYTQYTSTEASRILCIWKKQYCQSMSPQTKASPNCTWHPRRTTIPRRSRYELSSASTTVDHILPNHQFWSVLNARVSSAADLQLPTLLAVVAVMSADITRQITIQLFINNWQTHSSLLLHRVMAIDRAPRAGTTPTSPTVIAGSRMPERYATQLRQSDGGPARWPTSLSNAMSTWATVEHAYCRNRQWFVHSFF